MLDGRLRKKWEWQKGRSGLFLIERLVSVGTFFFLLMTVLWGLVKTKWSIPAILYTYTGVLAVMGFFYKPYTTSDLYRIYEQLDIYAQYDFFKFLKINALASTTPVSRILYWAMGKIGIHELLPAFAAAVTYFCIFYVVIKTAEMYEAGRVDVALTVLFLMSTGAYMMVISNIRTMMAVSLVCLCFFRESIENKNNKWHILLYLLAAGLHNMGLLVLLIRLSLYISKLKLSRKRWLLAGGGIMMLLLLMWVIVPEVMNRFILKVKDYFFGETYSYIWEYISGGIVMVLEYWILYLGRGFSDTLARRWKDTRNFLLICLLVACGFAWVFTFYIRFSTLVAPILAAPLLLIALGKGTDQRRKAVFAASMLALFLACARGQLCSYKFFVLP